MRGPEFLDRFEAGRVLAKLLLPQAYPADTLVLALPRGGVPVAYEVARALGAPLDVFLVRKLGAPSHEELAMGALASGGVRVLNREVVEQLHISPGEIDAATEREARELARRERRYRDGRPPPDVRGRHILLVDDGLATGSTLRAAVAALRQQGPAHLTVAVPVGAVASCASLAREADAVFCARRPEPFYAVGLWYRDFSQTSDDEVRALLALAERERRAGAEPAPVV